MKIQFISNGLEVSIPLNQLIRIQEPTGIQFQYHVLYAIRPGIILYGYLSEFPYASFPSVSIKEIVLRNEDELEYVLYQLTSFDLSKLEKVIDDILHQPPLDMFTLVNTPIKINDASSELAAGVVQVLQKVCDSYNRYK